MERSRRKFIKKSLAFAAGGTIIFGGTGNLFSKASAAGRPDLMAVRDGELDVIFDKAIGGSRRYG